jgi:disulfide bond formation protein DsbB
MRSLTRRERLGRAVFGLVLLAPAFVGNVIGFYFTLLSCHIENGPPPPGACPSDAAETALALFGVIGAAAVLPLLGLLGAAPRVLVGFGVAVWAVWLAYLLVLFPF